MTWLPIHRLVPRRGAWKKSSPAAGAEHGFRRWQAIAVGLLALALALCLGGIAFVFHAGRVMEGHLRWQSHSQEVRRNISDLERTVLTFEKMGRGILATGVADWEGPLLQAKACVAPEIAELRRLTADNPEQRASLERLQSLLEARIAALSARVEARLRLGRRGFPPTLDELERLFVDEGVAVGPEVKEVLAGMEAEEDRLLALRTEDIRSSAASFKRSLMTGAAATVPLVALALVLLRRRAKDREAADAALRAKQLEVDRLFRVNLDLLSVSSMEGRLIRLNQAWEATLGIPLRDLEGRLLRDLVEPSEAEALEAALARLGAREPAEFTGRFVCADGSSRWLEWRAIAEDGLAFGAARDITERRLGEEAVQVLTEQLRQSNRDLELFASLASHDLQEPLRMVAGFTELLARDYQGRLDPKADEYIGFAVDGARRMRRLIDDLLQFSRIGSRGKAMEAFETGVALQEAVLNLRQALDESGAVLTHDPMPVLEADGGQLALLFQNLVGNALKFRGAAAPAVHVGAVREGPAWHFTVRDNGIGIEPRHFQRVFDIFQRLHSREAYPGTGIGLALCKRIVERHRGRIWVESAPGAGTTFHFTLPAEGVRP